MSSIKLKCDNCGKLVHPVPAKDRAKRHEHGDIYSNIECPKCAALIYRPTLSVNARHHAIEIFTILKDITKAASMAGPHGTTAYLIADEKMKMATKVVDKIMRETLKMREVSLYHPHGTTLIHVFSDGQACMANGDPLTPSARKLIRLGGFYISNYEDWVKDVMRELGKPAKKRRRMD
jgi:hypothetical protein